MLRSLTDDSNTAFATNHLAVVAHFFNRRAYFHKFTFTLLEEDWQSNSLRQNHLEKFKDDCV